MNEKAVGRTLHVYVGIQKFAQGRHQFAVGFLVICNNLTQHFLAKSLDIIKALAEYGIVNTQL